MKNKLLAIMLVTVMTIGSSIPAFATPDSQQLTDSRQKYAEIENKIKDIETKMYDLDAQIEPLQSTVDKNKKEITNINKITENTEKDIEQCKKDIDILDLALGQRVKAMYQSGDLEFNYLSFVLESDSTSDFISRAEAVSKIVGKDKLSIEDIASKKEELNAKITSLQDKKNEIDKLNKEVETSLSQLDAKKKDEEVLVQDAKTEKSKFDSEYLSQLEREAVKAQFDAIDNTNSSSTEIQAAIDQLRSIRDNQIKSQIVTGEINDKIEKAKAVAAEKKVAEEKVIAAQKKEAEAKAVASNVVASRGRSTSSVAPPSAGNAQAILNEAYKHLGKAYVWGATGVDTFDCSGFTQYVYEHAAGIDISRTTYSQINVGQAVSQDQLQPGDLVFPHAGHVGIYVGNGQMINAPQTGDVVKVGPVTRFYAARRII